MKEGWESAALASFMSEAIEQLFGRVLFSRKDIQCTNTTFKQLLEYGFIEVADVDRYRVVITEEEYLAAKRGKKLKKGKNHAGFLADVRLSESDVKEFRAILAEDDAIKYFAPSIAPKIKEMDKVKAVIRWWGLLNGRNLSDGVAIPFFI